MAALWVTLFWLTIFIATILPHTTLGQFDFGTIYDFELTASDLLPASGDDVTFSCRRTDRYNRKLGQNFIDEEERISWKINGRALFATGLDQQGKCIITSDPSFSLGPPSYGHNRNTRYPNMTCEDDGSTIKLEVQGWTPKLLAGDVWRCLQFPFAESAKLLVQSFVPVSGVAIKQVIEKATLRKPSRGTFVTCRTTPCRPYATIDWYMRTGDTDVLITKRASSQEAVDPGPDELFITTSAILLTSDEDHNKEVYCKASNNGDEAQVLSRNVSLVIKYPPTLTIRVTPESSVLEGSDVTLHCASIGRPKPEIKWLRKAKMEEEEDLLVSLESTFTLQSVSVSDSAEYVCQASNGLAPDATGAVVLFVREKPAPVEDNLLVTRNEQREGAPATTADSDDGGAVAGGIIAAIVILALIVVIIWLVLRHRRSKRRNIENNSRHGAFNSDEGNQGIYATCSTMPRTMQLPPPYMEVLPPPLDDQKLSRVSNPGYGTGDNIITGVRFSRSANVNRPLPSRPFDCDSGYEEIDDNTASGNYQNEAPLRDDKPGQQQTEEIKRNSSTAHLINDGYEVPINFRKASQKQKNMSSSSTSPTSCTGTGICVSQIDVKPKVQSKKSSVIQRDASQSRKQNRKLSTTSETSYDTPF